MKKEIVTYPDKILPTVRSDMISYHKHGYTFEDYCDRNTHGRNYGKELYPIWLETKAEFDREREKDDCVSEDHRDEGREEKQNRRRTRKQHL